MTTRSDPYVCGYSDKVYPVPSLARDCEARHEKAPTD